MIPADTARALAEAADAVHQEIYEAERAVKKAQKVNSSKHVISIRSIIWIITYLSGYSAVTRSGRDVHEAKVSCGTHLPMYPTVPLMEPMSI